MDTNKFRRLLQSIGLPKCLFLHLEWDVSYKVGRKQGSCDICHIICVCKYVSIYIYMSGRVTPLPTFYPFRSYPTIPLRVIVTPLSTSFSHCNNRYLGGFGPVPVVLCGVGPVPVVLCGVAKYVGFGDGVPQHASGGLTKKRPFLTPRLDIFSRN